MPFLTRQVTAALMKNGIVLALGNATITMIAKVSAFAVEVFAWAILAATNLASSKLKFRI